MRQCFRLCFALAALLNFAPAQELTRAQKTAQAKAQNVPEIPFESVPNFLKLPPNLYLGEGIGVATNSKGHIFVYTRSQDTRLFEFDPKGNYVREIGEGLYGFVFAHAVRVDPQDNIWAVDEGSNMVIKFNPEGRVVMVLGRRPEPVEGIEATPPAGARAAGSAVHFNRPTDVALGRGRKHLRLRRLRQLARREVRQERPIHRVGRSQGIAARPVQSAAHDRGRRQGQRLRRRPQQPPHPGLRQRSEVQGRSTTRSARPGRVCISPGPHQYLYSSNSNPDNNNSPSRRGHRRDLQDGAGRNHPRQVRTRRASNWASSARCTKSIAATRTNCWSPKSPRGECRRLTLHPKPKQRARNRSEPSMTRHSQLFLAAQLLFACSLCAQSEIPEIPFDSAPNLLKLPEHIHLGEAAGVATNSKGNIFVYTRTGATNATLGGSRTFTHGGSRLFEFDPQWQSLSARSARASTGSCSRKPCASIRRTTSGWWTRLEHGDQVRSRRTRR